MVNKKNEPKTSFGYTRQYHVRLIQKQKELHQKALLTQNRLYQYALRYWYKTYGVKHIGRPLPYDQVTIAAMNNHIKAMFIDEKFKLKRWSSKKMGLSSHAADEFLKTCWTNFSMYHKHLVQSAKMTETERYNYKMNITKDKKGKHKNPGHKSWYRKGSMRFLRPGRSFRTITSQKVSDYKNPLPRMLTPHRIKVADFGELYVVEDMRNVDFSLVALTKIKALPDGTYRLQLTFTAPKTRKEFTEDSLIGLDWNMAHNEAYRSSENNPFFISPEIVNHANELEDKINQLKNKRDLAKNRNVQSRKTIRLGRRVSKLSAKRSNVLTNFYRHMVHDVVDKHDAFAIEKLDAYEMRKRGNGNKLEKNINRKLALIKPYELSTILESLIDKQGKTLIKVDAYHTSKVCHNCGNVYDKLKVGQKNWECPSCGAKQDRDLNAALNIKNWALHPEKHDKLKKYPKLKASNLAQVC